MSTSTSVRAAPATRRPPSIDQQAIYTFTPGEILDAIELNDSFAAVLPLTGGIVTGPVAMPVGGPGVDLPGTQKKALSINYTATPNAGPALVSTPLSVSTLVQSGNSDFNWSVSVFLDTYGNSGNQDVGIASQVIKEASNRSGTWQYFGNTKDLSGLDQPGRGGTQIGEFNLLVNGVENASTASNPLTGGRAGLSLVSRTYKPPNWAPNTAYTINTAIQPTGAPVWQANATHALGDVVRPTTGGNWAFRCINGGVSGSTEPTWPIVLGTRVTDGGVTWITITNVGNGYTYVCITPGSSGATEPVWPTVPGSVTDGSVTWQYGTTLAAQISRAIYIGDSDQGAVSYGAALLVTSPCYDAIIELSGASLDTNFNPTAAAIRLATEMPIDFAGNFTLAGQNRRTLKYTLVGAGRLAYSLPSGDLWQVRDDGVVILGNDTAGTSVLQLDTVTNGIRQIRFSSAGSERWAIITGISTSAPESGGNTGSDFQLTRYSDAGTQLGSPLAINRATGVMTFATAPVLTALPPNAANDAAAAGLGVIVGGEYRNGSIKMIRTA